MSKHVLAIEPQLFSEPPEREESLRAEAEGHWCQEAESHARAKNRIAPEEARERLQEWFAGGDYKRLIL